MINAWTRNQVTSGPTINENNNRLRPTLNDNESPQMKKETSENLYPISLTDANIVYRENIGALLRGAYMQSFSQTRIDSCRYKFPNFDEWWGTLNDSQRMRVKGVLAAYIF
jgi:hypothetical protein